MAYASLLPITFHCFNTIVSDFTRNRKFLGSDSESITKNPRILSTDQNLNVTQKYPRALGYGLRPFSVLGSIRLVVAHLLT